MQFCLGNQTRAVFPRKGGMATPLCGNDDLRSLVFSLRSLTVVNDGWCALWEVLLPAHVVIVGVCHPLAVIVFVIT